MSNPDSARAAGGDDADRVWRAITKIDVCFFNTRAGDGKLRGRPMSSIPRQEEGCIYFLTARSAGAKDEEIAGDGQVHLAYAAVPTFVSISGRARIIDDRALVEDLWNPGAQAFWPEGPQNRDVVAIAVEPRAAEFWEGPNKLVAGIKFAMALATGSTPNFGENRKVAL